MVVWTVTTSVDGVELSKDYATAKEAIEAFNQLPSEKKAGNEAFIRFSQVKDLAEDVGAQLDEFLLRERVLVPSSISVDIVQEAGERISFVPKSPDQASAGSMAQGRFTR